MRRHLLIVIFSLSACAGSSDSLLNSATLPPPGCSELTGDHARKIEKLAREAVIARGVTEQTIRISKVSNCAKSYVILVEDGSRKDWSYIWLIKVNKITGALSVTPPE